MIVPNIIDTFQSYKQDALTLIPNDHGFLEGRTVHLYFNSASRVKILVGALMLSFIPLASSQTQGLDSLGLLSTRALSPICGHNPIEIFTSQCEDSSKSMLKEIDHQIRIDRFGPRNVNFTWDIQDFKGKMSYSNGDVFEGEFHKQYPLKGKMTYNNGDVFESESFLDNPLKGKMTYHTNDLFEGTFLNIRKFDYGESILHFRLEGKTTFANGNVFIGNRYKRKLTDILNANLIKGTFLDIQDLSRYLSKYIFEGKLTFANGDIFEGNIHDDTTTPITDCYQYKFLGLEVEERFPMTIGTMTYANGKIKNFICDFMNKDKNARTKNVKFLDDLNYHINENSNEFQMIMISSVSLLSKIFF